MDDAMRHLGDGDIVGDYGDGGMQLPVGVGQPTLKIDAITVGGTA